MSICNDQKLVLGEPSLYPEDLLEAAEDEQTERRDLPEREQRPGWDGPPGSGMDFPAGEYDTGGDDEDQGGSGWYEQSG